METILITAPSLESSKNVGGISSLTKLTIAYNKERRYLRFVVGRKDGKNTSLFWFIKQIFMPIIFFIHLKKNKNVKICHLNVPQDPKGICRESVFEIISKLFKKKIVIHLRGGLYNLKIIKNVFLRNIFKWMLSNADIIICLGNNEKTFLAKNYQIKLDKIVVLENAVEIKSNKLTKDYTGILNVLFIGRIDKNKGFDEIILMLKSLHKKIDINLILCGTGTYEKYVLKEFDRIHGGKFEYHGVVTGFDKENLISKSQIFILPSYFEGLPNALLETMSLGVVPICTNVGSIPNVIKDSQNGYLIPVKDSHSLEEKILLLDSDRKLLEKLSQAAYDTIRENYSINKYIIKLNSTYDML